jgi:thioredoxin reductase (NADPH)
VVVDGKTEANTVIISTGASAKYLGIESEQRLRGGGVSACAVCGRFYIEDKLRLWVLEIRLQKGFLQ